MEYLELNGICYVGDVAYRLMCFKRETSLVNSFWTELSVIVSYEKALELIEENKIVKLTTVIL